MFFVFLQNPQIAPILRAFKQIEIQKYPANALLVLWTLDVVPKDAIILASFLSFLLPV